MTQKGAPVQDEKGLSARHLVLVFLAGVAVCAVFFSLGFLVGYNERSSKATPVTERVTSPPLIPPTVNPPPNSAQPPEKEAATATGSANGPAGLPEQVSAEPVPESRPGAAPAIPPAAARSPELSVSKSDSPAGPGPAARQAGPSVEVGTGFTIQVAASRTKQDAEALVNILKTRGYPVFLVAPEYAHANDNLFRVQVGPFTSRDDAEQVRTKLAQEGFKAFIKR